MGSGAGQSPVIGSSRLREVSARYVRAGRGGARELGERYRLSTEIGTGGFATVWKAFDRVEKKLVAVKVLHSRSLRAVSKTPLEAAIVLWWPNLRHPRP